MDDEEVDDGRHDRHEQQVLPVDEWRTGIGLGGARRCGLEVDIRLLRVRGERAAARGAIRMNWRSTAYAHGADIRGRRGRGGRHRGSGNTRHRRRVLGRERVHLLVRSQQAVVLQALGELVARHLRRLTRGIQQIANSAHVVAVAAANAAAHVVRRGHNDLGRSLVVLRGWLNVADATAASVVVGCCIGGTRVGNASVAGRLSLQVDIAIQNGRSHARRCGGGHSRRLLNGVRASGRRRVGRVRDGGGGLLDDDLGGVRIGDLDYGLLGAVERRDRDLEVVLVVATRRVHGVLFVASRGHLVTARGLVILDQAGDFDRRWRRRRLTRRRELCVLELDSGAALLDCGAQLLLVEKARRGCDRTWLDAVALERLEQLVVAQAAEVFLFDQHCPSVVVCVKLIVLF